jgi:predicted HTH domain antitoxin
VVVVDLDLQPGGAKSGRHLVAAKLAIDVAQCYIPSVVSVTISIPDEFADVLGSTAEERERRALEALALELYREGKISLRRMGELAGVGGDYWAADRLRAQHQVPLNYSVDELEADRQSAHRLLER